MSLSILDALRIAKDMRRGMSRATTIVRGDGFLGREKRDPRSQDGRLELGRSIERNSATLLKIAFKNMGRRF